MSEVQYEAERGAFDRTGWGGAAALLDTFSGDKGKIKDPVERFAVTVDAISRHLNSSGVVSIDENDIVRMLDRVRNVPYVTKKNPSAYVLGYVASGGGRRIDSKAVERIFSKALSEVADVNRPDVIRYARLWLTLG